MGNEFKKIKYICTRLSSSKYWCLICNIISYYIPQMDSYSGKNQRNLTPIRTYYTRWLIRTNSYDLTRFCTICLNPSDVYV